MKAKLFFLFLWIWSLLFLYPIKAQGDVFIISQVRGPESCCQPGSLTHLQDQLNKLQQYQFPGSFIYRFDALQDDNMVKAFKQAQKNNPHLSAGLWVEVTPSLASASGIIWHGNEKNWSKAEHSLLVGYSPNERKLLLDTLIAQFQQSFPNEPLLIAGAWGIDTDSLNYLQSKGLRVWQTVREQWEIDSYTADGSIINRPYFPSLNWYLNPSDQPRDLLVIKHTISDPWKNYGDVTSGYTSQPNDFNRVGFTVNNYFQPLLDQALQSHGSQKGWATIGLENSMPAEYQHQFHQQLDLIAQRVQNRQAQVITLSELIKRFITQQEASQISFTPAHDLLHPQQPLQAFWIETPYYRLRFRLTDEGLFLSDIRVYHPNFIDYYKQHQAQNGFFGIIPPLFSNQYQPKSIYKADDKTLATYTVKPDDNFKVALRFPPLDPNTLHLDHQTDQIILSYHHQQQKIEFIFQKQQWQSNIAGEKIGQTDYPWSHQSPISQQNVQQVDTNSYLYTFTTKPEKLEIAREENHALLLPEIKAGEANIQTSFFDWHNPYTQKNVLPSKLVLYPLDDKNYPVIPNNITIVTEPEIQFNVSELINIYLFIDFHSNQAQKVKVKIYLDQDLASEKKLYFLVDCQKNIMQCGLRPHYWWRWLHWKIQNRKLST